MKFWQSLAFTEAEQLVPLARIAERVGFEGVLVSDHLFVPDRLESKYPYSADGRPGFAGDTPFPEPWSTISAMAAVTTRLRFATMIYVLPLRHPIEVAKATGTAAVLSGNRLALGTGAGWIREEFDALGVDFRTRGRRYDECIEVLRKLWAGGRCEHHGRFFDFERLEMSPAPSKPPPIWIGGISEPALGRAARLGDGWIGTGQTPEEAAALLGRLDALRREAGRRDEAFETVVPLTTPPDVTVLAGLAEQGMSGAVAYPLVYSLGPGSSLAQKEAALEAFGEQVIAKLG